MTPAGHFITLLLCTFAAWSTIGAIRRDHDDPPTVRIKLAALIAGPPLLLLTVGVPFLTVIGYYLAGFILIYSLIYGLALILSLSQHGLTATVRELRDLPRDTAADHPPRRGQQRQGPQPPRRAVHIDRELTYNPYLMYDDPRGIDIDRIQQMKTALSEDEYHQLTLFWGWLRDTGQISSDDTPNGPGRHTQHRQHGTGTTSTPVVFKDQL